MGSAEPETFDYILQRGNWRASARLSHQHNILRQRFGYLIHPDIEAALNMTTSAEPIQILDLATGNGVWAIDAATSYPNAQITGLDISADSFPPKQICPDNTVFGILNILDDIPDEYVGKFDLVHVRYIMPGLLKPGTREIAVPNVMKMVKKGGWISWQEMAWPSNCEVKFENGKPVATMELPPFPKAMSKHFPIMPAFAWADTLDEQFRDTYKMTDVKVSKPEIKRELLRSETELNSWSLEEAVPGLMKMFVKPEAIEDIKEGLKQQLERAEKGALTTYMTMVVIGRNS